ncbi:hypothetical protein IWQ57_006899, partial [Coemansia nantahalensis]
RAGWLQPADATRARHVQRGAGPVPGHQRAPQRSAPGHRCRAGQVAVGELAAAAGGADRGGAAAVPQGARGGRRGPEPVALCRLLCAARGGQDGDHHDSRVAAAARLAADEERQGRRGGGVRGDGHQDDAPGHHGEQGDPQRDPVRADEEAHEPARVWAQPLAGAAGDVGQAVQHGHPAGKGPRAARPGGPAVPRRVERDDAHPHRVAAHLDAAPGGAHPRGHGPQGGAERRPRQGGDRARLHPRPRHEQGQAVRHRQAPPLAAGAVQGRARGDSGEHAPPADAGAASAVADPHVGRLSDAGRAVHAHQGEHGAAAVPEAGLERGPAGHAAGRPGRAGHDKV